MTYCRIGDHGGPNRLSVDLKEIVEGGWKLGVELETYILILLFDDLTSP